MARNSKSHHSPRHHIFYNPRAHAPVCCPPSSQKERGPSVIGIHRGLAALRRGPRPRGKKSVRLLDGSQNYGAPHQKEGPNKLWIARNEA